MSDKEEKVEINEELNENINETSDQKEDFKYSGKSTKDLEKKLKKVEESAKKSEKHASELSDKLLRSHAEFENYRKRVIKEREDVRTNTRMDAVNTIIPVLDHFDLALNAAKDAKNIEVVLEGMNMIKSEFEKALTSLGIEEINAVGKEFDPNFHEAVANEPSDEFEKDIVIKQWRSGYKFQDRLIRPASVVVSAGKPESSDEE